MSSVTDHVRDEALARVERNEKWIMATAAQRKPFGVSSVMIREAFEYAGVEAACKVIALSRYTVSRYTGYLPVRSVTIYEGDEDEIFQTAVHMRAYGVGLASVTVVEMDDQEPHPELQLLPLLLTKHLRDLRIEMMRPDMEIMFPRDVLSGLTTMRVQGGPFPATWVDRLPALQSFTVDVDDWEEQFPRYPFFVRQLHTLKITTRVGPPLFDCLRQTLALKHLSVTDCDVDDDPQLFPMLQLLRSIPADRLLSLEIDTDAYDQDWTCSAETKRELKRLGSRLQTLKIDMYNRNANTSQAVELLCALPQLENFKLRFSRVSMRLFLRKTMNLGAKWTSVDLRTARPKGIRVAFDKALKPWLQRHPRLVSWVPWLLSNTWIRITGSELRELNRMLGGQQSPYSNGRFIIQRDTSDADVTEFLERTPLGYVDFIGKATAPMSGGAWMPRRTRITRLTSTRRTTAVTTEAVLQLQRTIHQVQLNLDGQFWLNVDLPRLIATVSGVRRYLTLIDESSTIDMPGMAHLARAVKARNEAREDKDSVHVVIQFKFGRQASVISHDRVTEVTGVQVLPSLSAIHARGAYLVRDSAASPAIVEIRVWK